MAEEQLLMAAGAVKDLFLSQSSAPRRNPSTILLPHVLRQDTDARTRGRAVTGLSYHIVSAAI